MQDIKNNISLAHQEKLEEIFTFIAGLIDSSNLSEAVAALLELHSADIADFLDNSRDYYQDILPLLADSVKPEVLIWISDSNKEPAIEAFGIPATARMIEALDFEDAIEVIEALSPELKEEILLHLPKEKSKQILEGFTYPENTAGRIVQKNFIALKNVWTVSQALDMIRQANIKTDFYALIVADGRARPIGTILLSTLLKSPLDANVSELMNKECMIAETHTEVEEIAFLFKQYALTIVPVVNKQGKLVGNISLDSILYIIDEQTESDFLHLGGINNSDIFDDLYKTAKSRFPWLFINLIIACITCLVIDRFNDTIAQIITAATMMPIVASMGGNAGTQVMTITIHAISNRGFSAANNMRVITKEIYVCIINGLVLSFIGGIITYLLFWHANLSIVFASSVLINFAFAGLLGSAIPIILNRFDIDPTAASSVFLTAGTDSIGFFTFLALTYAFLM